ncbi:MAG TPA: triose-phosphate isomerase [Beijerinckiaceae bacterium]|nr:triose-phosphate isomerase [Beijerinckiaceae bacterium]
MNDRRRPLVAGNWKMNGLRSALAELAAMVQAYDEDLRACVEILVCPPATLLSAAAHPLIGSGIALGGQDCHAEASGAFTGCISAEMVADAGAAYVLVGHSERRCAYAESDVEVRAKAQAAVRAGLEPIVCIGENRQERESGKTFDVLGAQVRGSLPDCERLTLAYEPVWAIGSGLTPTVQEIGEAHRFIRERAELARPGLGASTRILYGGSVGPQNAAELMAASDVDGALVGGASLTAGSFMAIAEVFRGRRLE